MRQLIVVVVHDDASDASLIDEVVRSTTALEGNHTIRLLCDHLPIANRASRLAESLPVSGERSRWNPARRGPVGRAHIRPFRRTMQNFGNAELFVKVVHPTTQIEIVVKVPTTTNARDHVFRSVAWVSRGGL